MNIFLLLFGLLGIAGGMGAKGGPKGERDTVNVPPGTTDGASVPPPADDDGLAEEPEDPPSHDHGGHGGSGGTPTDDGGSAETPDDKVMDGSGGGGHDHGSHDDGHTDHGASTSPEPPGIGASSGEILSYLAELSAMAETHVHGSGSELAPEHMAVMGLVPRGEATHVAIGDGDWFDPATWSTGTVPGEDARVLIPEHVTVDYAGVSVARLFTVRVDGKLDFATDVDSRIVFDTFVVSPSGHLEIGTAADPVHPDVDIKLIVADNGPIDVDWDSFLLSRGLISHGNTTIHGAETDAHEKVIADPMKGDTFVRFAEVPEGWEVGDTIVIAGTHYDGYRQDPEIHAENYFPPEDEIRVITAIDADGRIHFDDPLVFDHDAPRDDLKTSVANYSRNVTIESENAETLEVFERGHVMMMHGGDVDIRYAAFEELGRTDKSETSMAAEDFGGDIAFDSNVQGRYALHLHRLGTDEDPAMIVGNAVWGSPGWGYVHHDSNAILDGNASFDTFGAGYVAETGNETGTWIDNIAIYAQGISWGVLKNTVDLDNFDTAKSGDGFWFQGRLVTSTDNIAASVNHGFVYFHRDGEDRGMINSEIDDFAYSDAIWGGTQTQSDNIPILGFDGNEAFAVNQGLHILKADSNQHHDVWTKMSNFTAWSALTGAEISYTTHYILEDFDLVARDATPQSRPLYGIEIGKFTNDIVILDSSVDGFATGIDLYKEFRDPDTPEEEHYYAVIDTDVINSKIEDYGHYDSSIDFIGTRADLPYHKPDLDLGTLRFEPGTDGRLAVLIDGTKYDSVGEMAFPAGMEVLKVKQPVIEKLLDEDGYFQTSGGENYMLLDVHFTDRLTGEVFVETHPVWLGDFLASRFGEFNGTQDILRVDGHLKAGDVILDEARLALPDAGHDMTVTVGAGQVVANHGHVTDIDLEIDGGTAVLAHGGASLEIARGHTLAIDDAAAWSGFDGTDGGLAILDLDRGATVSFSAESGDLGQIVEGGSGLHGSATELLSGIDLEGAVLEIDLAGLDAAAGHAFTLMDADEIAGIFTDARVTGLGDKDARIVVDYSSDKVTLELTAGSGAISVDTVGTEGSVATGEETLWLALTQDHGLEDDSGTYLEDDEMEMTHVA